jgi:hypothetical protein
MPGAARQQVTLFCLSKIQVTKQKDTPPHRPFGLPSVFRVNRAAALNSAFGLRQTQPTAPDSPGKPRRCRGGFGSCGRSPCFGCPPRRGGLGGEVRFLFFRSPWSTAEQHSRAGGSRRGLSERKARVPQPPGSARSAGNPEGAVDRGGFLWLTFFSRLKKVTSPPGCPRHLNIRAERAKPIA